MKHNKIIAGLAIAGSLFAMSGAANAIAPAAALGLGVLGGAAVASAAAEANVRGDAAVAVAPVVPATTVVMGAAPAGHYESINGAWQWVPDATVTTNVTATGVTNFDHDGDGVLNHSDRFPNDQSRS